VTAKNHTRRKRCAPQGHDNTVAAAFAPDGGRVLTASVNTAQLWDRDGKPLAILKGRMDLVVSAVFVPTATACSPPQTTTPRAHFAEVLKLIDNVKTEVPRCLIPTAPTLLSRTASALVRGHAQVALRWHDILT